MHVEGLWAENRYTAEGNILHARAHDPRRSQSRPGVRIARGLELRSYELGLCGKADVVEFCDNPDESRPAVLIVEYKRGKPKPEREEEFRVQLCAQALCLEEMLETRIDFGTLYHGQSRRRTIVPFDDALRRRTTEAAGQLREMILAKETPPAEPGAKCRRCSLKYLCMPKTYRKRKTARQYLNAIANEPLE